MRKIIKLALLTVSLGVIISLTLVPTRQGQAAPPYLPPCGDGNIEALPTRRAGPPDIAQSNDADQYYTAVAWSLGENNNDERGVIRLAYSTIYTDTDWTFINVDSNTSDNNLSPSIAFDPVISNVIHVAYQKQNGIFYRRCDLSNTSNPCGSSRNISAAANGNGALESDSLPQLAVIAGTPAKVAIVYQHKNVGSNLDYIEVAAFNADGTGGITSQKLTTNLANSTGVEKYPSAAASNGRVHVAYVNTGGVGSPTQYLFLTAADLASLAPKGPAASFSHSGATDVQVTDTPAAPGPQGTTLAAYGSRVLLLWQVFGPLANKYYLVYKLSTDNGATWNTTPGAQNFYYLFTGTAAAPAGRQPWNKDTLATTEFQIGLKADASMDEGGNAHVVWQVPQAGKIVGGELIEPRDIFYSQFKFSSAWASNSESVPTHLISATTGALPSAKYINLTQVYEAGNVGSLQAVSRFEPAVVFGGPGKRLQLVYMGDIIGSDPKTGIYYNGFQLADEDTPGYEKDDSDCDWLYDTAEYPVPSGANCPSGTSLTDMFADCDGDGIPNFMDIDSDNDGANDLKEYIFFGANRDDPDTLWPIYDAGTGLPNVYLPLLLKNNS